MDNRKRDNYVGQQKTGQLGGQQKTGQLGGQQKTGQLGGQQQDGTHIQAVENLTHKIGKWTYVEMFLRFCATGRKRDICKCIH